MYLSSLNLFLRKYISSYEYLKFMSPFIFIIYSGAFTLCGSFHSSSRFKSLKQYITRSHCLELNLSAKSSRDSCTSASKETNLSLLLEIFLIFWSKLWPNFLSNHSLFFACLISYYFIFLIGTKIVKSLLSSFVEDLVGITLSSFSSLVAIV